jgi:ketosteroid isomerase-like protein
VEAPVQRWARTWRERWPEHDVEALVELYAEDAVFVAHPFHPATTPREHIEAVVGGDARVEPWFGEPLVDGGRAAVEWRVVIEEAGDAVTYAGTSLLRFGEDGRCVEERAVWMMREGRS